MVSKALRYATLFAIVLSTRGFGLDVGETGPCVVLEDIQPDGSSIQQCIRTPKQKGEFVVLEFFTSKCEDCAQNVGIVNTLAGEIAATATTRMVGSDRDADSLGKFLQDHHAQIVVPVSLDLEVNAMKAYGVNAMPTVFILNPKNKILWKHVGVLSPEDVAAIKNVVK